MADNYKTVLRELRSLKAELEEVQTRKSSKKSKSSKVKTKTAADMTEKQLVKALEEWRTQTYNRTVKNFKIPKGGITVIHDEVSLGDDGIPGVVVECVHEPTAKAAERGKEAYKAERALYTKWGKFRTWHSAEN